MYEVDKNNAITMIKGEKGNTGFWKLYVYRDLYFLCR